MTLLTPEELNGIRSVAATMRRGECTTQGDLDRLCDQWEPRVQPSQKNRAEHFAIARPDGVPTGITGPRWVFHLFGLRHRAVEVALSTPAGLILIQRRSPTKDDWPGAFDMAVAGHVPQQADGSDMAFEAAAWKEIAEEIGLAHENVNSILVEGELTAVGRPYCCFESDWKRNPPFFDAEVRQIYAATLSGEGLAGLHFADGEAAGMFLVTIDTAWQVLREETIASGLRFSLPRYLDWLDQGRPGAS